MAALIPMGCNGCGPFWLRPDNLACLRRQMIVCGAWRRAQVTGRSVSHGGGLRNSSIEDVNMRVRTTSLSLSILSLGTAWGGTSGCSGWKDSVSMSKCKQTRRMTKPQSKTETDIEENARKGT